MTTKDKGGFMPSMNRVLLIGYLGHEPEERKTPKGLPVVSLRLATTARWKDQSGERRERTEWHRIVAFGQQASFIAGNAKTGALMHVEGSLRTRDWTDKAGAKRYMTEVVARQVQLLDRKEKPAGAPPKTEEPPAEMDVDEIEDEISF